MPMLPRRRAAPLLRLVGNKPHATNDDHVEQLPTPPSTTNNSARSSLCLSTAAANTDDDEITRSPESSEDETATANAREQSLGKPTAGFRAPRRFLEEEESVVKKTTTTATTFRKPASFLSSSQDSRRSKRSRDEMEEKEEDGGHSSDSNGIFESNKKSKALMGFANIHAPGRRKKMTQYGSKNQARAKAAAEKAAKFKQRKEEEKAVEPPRPKFQKSRVIDNDDVFEFGGRGDEPTSSGGFRLSGSLEEDVDDRLLSQALSCFNAPDSPIIEETPTADSALEETTTCPICSDSIPTDHMTSFQRTFTKGSPILNYRWQQRFCRWHKQQDAMRLSAERGYPEIDWNRLPSRMRGCEMHLKRVIKGEVPSIYRDQLAEVLESGKGKTALGVLAAAADSDGEQRRYGGGCGYYGPKGERIMTEHIVSQLSAEIRAQATRDRLVAASGVSGGVSGFVQAVLVPELAERLICEDLKLEPARAREVMRESAEIGELLHPDANDLVGEVGGMEA